MRGRVAMRLLGEGAMFLNGAESLLSSDGKGQSFLSGGAMFFWGVEKERVAIQS